jgi:uncharacterized protein (DUF1499 family)
MAVTVAAIAAALILGGSMGLFSGTRPGNLGVRDGRLAACPDTPNCVSSQSDAGDAGHAISPFAFNGPPAAAWAGMVDVLRQAERCVIIEKKSGYLHAEFTSHIMGFVDDVELLLDEKVSVIHVRSASRLGSSDFGVNRKRIEALRASLAARLAPATTGR